MNLVTNEIGGLLLLPLGVRLNYGVWDLVNETALLFIPLAVIIIKAFFESRSQGLDEGSPAVLAIKLVEKFFWGYIVVIAFVLTPYQSRLNVEHRQFACAKTPSIISDELSLNGTIVDGALNSLGLNDNISPPLFVGLIHQMTTGITEAAKSQLTCSSGASVWEINTILKTLAPSTESVHRSIEEFNANCYQVAKNTAHDAIAQGKDVRFPTDNTYGWSFYPPSFAANADLISGVYDGSFISGQSTSPLTMEVPTVWFNKSIPVGSSQLCSDLAVSLYDKIETDLRADGEVYQDSVQQISDFVSLFNQMGEPEITHDLVMTVFDNVVGGVTKLNEAKGVPPWKALQVYVGIRTGLSSEKIIPKSLQEEDQTAMEWFTSMAVGVGSVVNTMIESPKARATTIILPMIVTIIQIVLITALPLLVVISGFSSKFLYNWTLMYFSVTFSTYFLNVGIQIEALLLSLTSFSDSLISHALGSGGADSAFLVSATAANFVYLLPVIWVMLVQIVGNVAASSFMNAVSGAAMVGQSGGEMAVNQSMKGGDFVAGNVSDNWKKIKTKTQNLIDKETSNKAGQNE